MWDHAAGALIGIPTAFLFFTYFLLIFYFGFEKKTSNIVTYTIPALAVFLFEYWFYPQPGFLMGFVLLGLYYPFMFGLFGLGLGLLIRKGFDRLRSRHVR